MAVSQARLNAYRSDVDAAAEAAGMFVNDYIGTLMALYPDMSVADIRDEAIEAIKDALNAFGDQAATTALELLEEIVASYGISVTTSIVDAIDDAMIDGGVRYAARNLVTGNVAAFTADVSDLSRFYIKRSAFENMVANCERNDLRYARVPSGLETCSFCFMLSTRGFVYHTAYTAGEGHPYHRNCSCVVTPGYEGISWDSQVEGYEPNEMYKRWAACAKTISLDPDTKDKSEQKAIRKEVDTRDYRWLNTGEASRIDTSSYSKKKLKRLCSENPEEWSGYVSLSESGVSQKLFVADPSASANIDFAWQKNGSSQYWELKTPRTDEWALTRLLEEAYSKWERLTADGAALPSCIDISQLGNPRVVVDNRYSDISDSSAVLTIRDQMSYLSERGNFEFSEAVLIRKDGTLYRVLA